MTSSSVFIFLCICGLNLLHGLRFQNNKFALLQTPYQGIKAYLAHQDPVVSFGDAWVKATPFTMVNSKRTKFMWDAIAKVNQEGIEGDIVEAGVWKGGVSMVMAYANLKDGAQFGREHWLYDTFEGLPAPDSPNDGDDSKKAWEQVLSGKSRDKYVDPETGKWCYGALDIVQHNMEKTGLSADKLHFIKGKVEDTLKIPENLPSKIAILRLDTDWYDSTKAELNVLYDRLQPGGLLFIDDYCAWGGARKATDEWIESHKEEAKEAVLGGKLCLYLWKPKQ